MRRIIITILVLLTLLLSFSLIPSALGYWSSDVSGSYKNQDTGLIYIGEWKLNSWETDYNLNEWEKNGELNQVVPKDTVFSYDGLLYIVRPDLTGEYVPEWHGLPGENSIWAMFALDLEWKPHTNYRVYSVVVRDGRWFIANNKYDSNGWFTNDPLTHSGAEWSQWREIEPLTENDFDYLDIAPSLRDYRKINNEGIIYK